jgi:hypothetical protein
MQPCPTLLHPIAPTAQPAAAAPLALRLAQRAFSVVLEWPSRRAGADAFRRAQLANGARRTLSALSADESAALARWLALQFASRGDATAARVQAALARLDAPLAAEVAAALGGARRRLRVDAHATVA